MFVTDLKIIRVNVLLFFRSALSYRKQAGRVSAFVLRFAFREKKMFFRSFGVEDDDECDARMNKPNGNVSKTFEAPKIFLTELKLNSVYRYVENIHEAARRRKRKSANDFNLSVVLLLLVE